MGLFERCCVCAVAAAVVTVASPVVMAQPRVDSRMTSIYGRAGFSLGVLSLDELAFSAQRPHHARVGSFSGKQLGWGREVLPGLSLGLNIDARWFYVRAGATLYDSASIDSAVYDARFTTIASLSAGPRFFVGPIVLFAGLRAGALFSNVTERASGTEYSALHGIVGVDAGAQWRPWRWVQFDLTVGQDVLSLRATTVSLAINLGWSREP